MDIETEEWKSLPGYEGKYEVSNLGSVRSISRWSCEGQGRRWIEGRVRVLTLGPDGYPRVWLSPESTPTVHRLIGEAFLGPLPEGLETRHLDGDRTNCRSSNLKYGTRSENKMDQIKHGTHKYANRTHCGAGHRYTEENTAWRMNRSGNMSRHCRTCERKQRRDYVARNRSEVNRRRRKEA
jgi:hypothetical protein